MSEHQPQPDSRNSINGDTGSETRLKRAPVACKRCRRLRGKCVHNGATPCESCREAGPVETKECYFPARGDKGSDRHFRQKRAKRSSDDSLHDGAQRDISEDANQSRTKRSDHPLHALNQPDDSQILNHSSSLCNRSELLGIQPRFQTHSYSLQSSRSAVLPPHQEVQDGCKVFIVSFFQLGFVPKALFMEQLASDPESVDAFLLLSMLSLSGRFTPSLVRRYGSQAMTTEYFLAQASILIPGEMYQPSLERIQSFFLLGIAEWGNGDRNRSCIHMAIAIKMAGLLCLHQEETYTLSNDSTSDEIVNSEKMRRTFWMLESQDNLHSGHNTPASFSLADITTLLPCDESDFAFGIISTERAALPGTRAAMANPSLTSVKSQSLFASLIRTHNLWGSVARRACRNGAGLAGPESEPWKADSEYERLTLSLRQWSQALPKRHTWSVRNLRGYKAECLDLAYLSVVMSLQLSNIVVRRVHLEEMLASLMSESAQTKFWEDMSYELFSNVFILYEQIDAFFSHRSSEEGFPAMIVFCVYIAGSLSTYLWKYPQLCPKLAEKAEAILDRCLDILETLQHAWPTAQRWAQSLRVVAIPSATTQEQFLSLADGIEQPSNEIALAPRLQQTSQDYSGNLEMLSDLATRINQGTDDQELLADMSVEPIDNFEAELTAFLRGEVNLGITY